MPKFRLILLTLVISLSSVLNAGLNVHVKNDKSQHILSTSMVNGVEYADFKNINPLFGSVTKEDRADHRYYFHLYGEQFVFFLDSAYYTYKTETFCMQYPLAQSGSEYLIPLVFLTEHLPLHFPQSVQYRGTTLQITKAKDKSVLRIVLDPGHGGKDPGAVGKKGTREKDLNLNVCLKLKQLLEKELGITVLMTRSDDRFVSLGERTRFANEKKADLFVSVHTNASYSRSTKGLETYYLSTAKNTDSRAVEALENGVVELYEGAEEKQKYDDLDFILSDLSQAEHLENSNSLAIWVHKNMVAGTKSQDRGVKQANFWVLRGAFMPSILIEMGFISNLEEEAMLNNPSYQERIARAIFEGIKHFKHRFDRIRNA
jgi:N-acetylmuramoyl-L-alanine amidase